jgi:hypothetical protein
MISEKRLGATRETIPSRERHQREVAHHIGEYCIRWLGFNIRVHVGFLDIYRWWCETELEHR